MLQGRNSKKKQKESNGKTRKKIKLVKQKKQNHLFASGVDVG
jgi:hypothetical protein